MESIRKKIKDFALAKFPNKKINEDNIELLAVSYIGTVENEPYSDIALFNVLPEYFDTNKSKTNNGRPVMYNTVGITLSSLSKLRKKIIIHDVRRSGTVKMIEASLNNDISKVVLRYPVYATKHVHIEFRHLCTITKDILDDDMYLKLADIINEYPCIISSSVDGDVLTLNVCE
jgi:hypothetical protein